MELGEVSVVAANCLLSLVLDVSKAALVLWVFLGGGWLWVFLLWDWWISVFPRVIEIGGWVVCFPFGGGIVLHVMTGPPLCGPVLQVISWLIAPILFANSGVKEAVVPVVTSCSQSSFAVCGLHSMGGSSFFLMGPCPFFGQSLCHVPSIC